MQDDAPPTLAPVVAPTIGPPRRGPRLPVAVLLATALGVVTVAASVAALVGSSSPARDDGSAVRWQSPPHFGAGTEPRLRTLRDRLARGLLSLRRTPGDFSTRADDGMVDPVERIEATAIGVAGLAAAVRLGADAPGLVPALAGTKDLLGKRQSKGGGFDVFGSKPRRGLAVSTLGCAVLALSLAEDPTDGARLDRAGQTLVDLAGWGPLAGGWVQGAAVRAMGELVASGRLRLLGTPTLSAIPTRNIGEVRDNADPRVSEALAQAVLTELGAYSPVPDEVLAKVLADPPTWVGDRSDLNSWALQAWLAARRPGGDAWFSKILPVLEEAVPSDGVVPGEAYGYPVSRTACALLILWEGWGLHSQAWDDRVAAGLRAASSKAPAGAK